MITRNDNNTDRDSAVNNKSIFDSLNNETHNNFHVEKNEKKIKKKNCNSIKNIIVTRADADSGTFSSEEDNMSREDYYEVCSTSSSVDLLKNDHVSIKNNFFFVII